MDNEKTPLGFLSYKNSDELAPAYRKCIARLRASLPARVIKHRDYDSILKGLTNYYNEVRHLFTEELRHAGQYIFCGMYAPYIYPSGETSRVNQAAKFYLLWVYVDDVLDASTDIDVITTICTSFRKVAMEPFNPTIDCGVLDPEIFERVSEFLHGWDCDAEVASMLRYMFLQYLDHTLLCRAAEVEQRTMWIDEYLMCRSFNVVIPMLHVFGWFTNPGLDIQALREDDIKRAIIASGRSIGLTMDMFNLRSSRPDKTTFVNVYHILKNSLALSHEDAQNRAGDLLDEAEAEFLRKIQVVSEKFPLEANAIAELHHNTQRWILDADTRYRQKSENGKSSLLH